MNSDFPTAKARFYTRYWSGGRGPWKPYADMYSHRCSRTPPHEMGRASETFEAALTVAKEHMAENPTQRYPIGVFKDAYPNPLAIIEGVNKCPGHVETPRYDLGKELVVCV